MFLQVGLILTSFLFAFSVLFASIFRSTQTNVFRSYLPNHISNVSKMGWEGRSLLSFGEILPDHPLWVFLAAKDKLFHMAISNPLEEGKYSLNCSNKRVLASKALFDKGNPDLGMATLVKGTLYLEEAAQNEELSYKEGVRSDDLLTNLALSSVKQKSLTDEILEVAPESARPDVIRIQDRSRSVFQKASREMEKRGLTPPKSPFNSE